MSLTLQKNVFSCGLVIGFSWTGTYSTYVNGAYYKPLPNKHTHILKYIKITLAHSCAGECLWLSSFTLHEWVPDILIAIMAADTSALLWICLGVGGWVSRLEKAAKGREGSYTSLVYTAQCPLFIHGRLLKYIEGDAVEGFVFTTTILHWTG